MTIVICREQDFRERAMWHGADTFVEMRNLGDNVVPFRLVAMKQGVPGALATYQNDRTEDAWLWRETEPMLHLCDEMDEGPSLWSLAKDWATAALLIVFVGVLTAIFVGFGG